MVKPPTFDVGAVILTLYTISTVTAIAFNQHRAPGIYSPYPTTCPTMPLLRDATNINPSEQKYISARKAKADAALASWLRRTNPWIDTRCTLPTVGLVGSGGSYRALLNEAGILQAFDDQETAGNSSVAGLYQAFTYHAALSGGAWLLASLAGNNWPTISWLQKNVWDTTFPNGLLQPGGSSSYVADSTQINIDVAVKASAGYDVSLIDPFGRMLGYNLLSAPNGGPDITLSGLTSSSNFVQYNAPFPIITSIGLDVPTDQCTFVANATQYEFTPFEFGSWDAGVSAFIQSKYLGSSMVNGVTTFGSPCTAGLDNLGYIAGISSNVFPVICNDVPGLFDTSNLSGLATALKPAVSAITTLTATGAFAEFSNPFYQYPRSNLVASAPKLYLADGGTSDQWDPVWPLIQPSRNLSVVLLLDISTPNSSYPYVDPIHLYNSYVQAKAQGLTRMPVIPPPDVFESLNLYHHATFFGCNQPETVTILWIPYLTYTYPSNYGGGALQFNSSEVSGIIGNGNAIGTQNGDSGWATCLGCAIMKKTGTSLPASCAACFLKYCFN